MKILNFFFLFLYDFVFFGREDLLIFVTADNRCPTAREAEGRGETVDFCNSNNNSLGLARFIKHSSVAHLMLTPSLFHPSSLSISQVYPLSLFQGTKETEEIGPHRLFIFIYMRKLEQFNLEVEFLFRGE